MTHRIAALLAAALASLAFAGVVLAHAELVHSEPAAGATIETPYTLTATFDDELTADGSSIVVEDAAGTQVATGTVSETDEFSMTAQLPNLAPGTYTVRWTAVTADDAAVERGTYTFNVAEDPGPARPTPPPNDGLPGLESKDPIVAVGLAAIAIILILAFIFFRRRR